MKPKNIIIVILGLITLSTSCLVAQENKYKDIDKAAASLNKAFDNMHNNAVFKKNNLPCEVENIAESYSVYFNEATLFPSLRYLQTRIEDINYDSFLIDKGTFATKFDRVLQMFEPSMSYSKFLDVFSTKSRSELSKEEDLDMVLIHGLFTALHDGGTLLTHFEDTADTGGCDDSTEYKVRILKKNLGQITWEIKTIVDIDCNCKDANKKYNIDKLKFEYSAEVSGLFTANKKTFSQSKNPTLKIIRYQCCPEKEEEKEEPTETALNDDDGIEDLMQDQTIGFGAGVGFAQDFDETTFCVTAEYLYQINADEYKGWYVGAEASYSNTSFGDFNSSKTIAGGKIQYNFSGVPSGETQFVAGLMANYAFGKNDNNGFKDDFTGTIFCAYGGVNIRVSENWSIGAQFPFLIFENFTFKPEGGGEFKADATSLFINKENPLKIIVRKRL